MNYKLISSFWVLMLLASVGHAQMPDWKEGSGTVACGYALSKPRPGKSPGQPGYIQDIPFPIYAQPADTKPKTVVTEQKANGVFLLGVEKKGIWIKVRAAGSNNPMFKAGQFLGYVKEPDLEWGALRNCS
jgi:hypothetical protein